MGKERSTLTIKADTEILGIRGSVPELVVDSNRGEI